MKKKKEEKLKKKATTPTHRAGNKSMEKILHQVLANHLTLGEKPHRTVGADDENNHKMTMTAQLNGRATANRVDHGATITRRAA